MNRAARPAVRFLSLVSLLLILPLWVAAYSYVRIVRLSWVEGEVSLLRPGAGAVRGQLSLPLEHDAAVETPGGVAEVEFEDETFARLATGSRLHLAELGLEDNGARVTELRLEQGTASFSVRLHGSDRFLVQAGELRVRAQRHARFRVDVTPEGNRVRVFDGQVEVEAPSGRLTVGEGRMVEWEAATGRLELTRNLPPDSWDEWVEAREQVAGVLQYRPAATSTWSLGQPWNSYSCQSFGWYPRWHSSYGGWYFDPYLGYRWNPWGYGWNWYNGGLYGWGSTGCGGWPLGYWGGWPYPIPGTQPGDPPPPGPTPSPSPSPIPPPSPAPGHRPRVEPLEPVIPSVRDEEGSLPFRRRRRSVPLIEFQPQEIPPAPSALPAPPALPQDGQPGTARRLAPRATTPEPNRARPSRTEMAPRSRESRPAQVTPAPRPPAVNPSRTQSPAPRPAPPPPRPSAAPRPRPRS